MTAWKNKPLDVRKAEANKIRTKSPGQVPVVVELHSVPGKLTQLPRNKYLVSMRAPSKGLRDAIAADARDKGVWNAPLYIFLAGTTAEVDSTLTLGSLDEQHRDEDGFLYVEVSALATPVVKKPVPYAQTLLAAEKTRGASAGNAAAASAADLASPHGDRLPSGADISSCTFLNPRASGKLLPELRPTGRGRVPPSLYLATLLDVTAVGLVVPLLAAYSRALGAGPRFTGLLQATYGLSQLLGAHILGGLSDTLGRRSLLRVSSLGGLVGYASLAAAVGPHG